MEKHRNRANKNNKTRRDAGLCHCGAEADDGYTSCSAHREYQRVYKQEEAESGRTAARVEAKVARSECTKCPNPTTNGDRLCDTCQHNSRQKYSRNKAAGLCTSCKSQEAVSGHVECEDCKDKRWDSLQLRAARKRLAGECYFCPALAREDSTRCADCVDRADERLLAKTSLPPPSISIFQALDLKHDFILSKLKQINLPGPNCLYIDSEMFKIALSNAASNIYEWTAYSCHPEEGGTWYTLRENAGQVSDKVLQEWASEMEDWIADKLVIAYGTSKPELHRILNLQAHLPPDQTPTQFNYFDVQQSIVRQIFSYNPSDELDANKPIYLPFFGLEYIGKHLNKTSTGTDYVEWEWPTLSKDCSTRGKSVYDVSMMYNLLHALRYVKDGHYFAKQSFKEDETLATASSTSHADGPQRKKKKTARVLSES